MKKNETAQKLRSLLKELAEQVEAFRRAHRPVLAERIQNQMYGIEAALKILEEDTYGQDSV